MVAQDALHAAGAEAESLKNLWWVFLWVCAAAYVSVVAFFIAAWIRGRRNRWKGPEKCDQRASEDKQRRGDDHQDLVLGHVRGEELLA